MAAHADNVSVRFFYRAPSSSYVHTCGAVDMPRIISTSLPNYSSVHRWKAISQESQMGTLQLAPRCSRDPAAPLVWTERPGFRSPDPTGHCRLEHFTPRGVFTFPRRIVPCGMRRLASGDTRGTRGRPCRRAHHVGRDNTQAGEWRPCRSVVWLRAGEPDEYRAREIGVAGACRPILPCRDGFGRLANRARRASAHAVGRSVIRR
jgi:hypothetical protein